MQRSVNSTLTTRFSAYIYILKVSKNRVIRVLPVIAIEEKSKQKNKNMLFPCRAFLQCAGIQVASRWIFFIFLLLSSLLKNQISYLTSYYCRFVPSLNVFHNSVVRWSTICTWYCKYKREILHLPTESSLLKSTLLAAAKAKHEKISQLSLSLIAK